MIEVFTPKSLLSILTNGEQVTGIDIMVKKRRSLVKIYVLMPNGVVSVETFKIPTVVNNELTEDAIDFEQNIMFTRNR